jgi:hypothetical protein
MVADLGLTAVTVLGLALCAGWIWAWFRWVRSSMRAYRRHTAIMRNVPNRPDE